VRIVAALVVGAVIGAGVVGVTWWATSRQSRRATTPVGWIAKGHVSPDNGMSNDCGYAVRAKRSGGVIVCGINGNYVCFSPDATDLQSTGNWLPAGDCPNGAIDALRRAHVINPV
jgi:hypothetical protein